MAIHSSILAWEIPWTENPGRLQVRRVTQSWARLKQYFKINELIFSYTTLPRFLDTFFLNWVSLMTYRVKCLPAMWETRVQSLSREDPLEKEMATHSSTLAWKIPWTEEPGRLQSMGSQRVGHD